MADSLKYLVRKNEINPVAIMMINEMSNIFLYCFSRSSSNTLFAFNANAKGAKLNNLKNNIVVGSSLCVKMIEHRLENVKMNNAMMRKNTA